LYFVLRYSAILIISVLYATSTCTSPLPPSFLFTYNLSMSGYVLLLLLLFLPTRLQRRIQTSTPPHPILSQFTSVLTLSL
jgi:hypothetical protein